MTILLGLLKLFGWQRLLKMTWKVVYPDLVKFAKRSDTQIDDNGLEMINEMIGEVATKK
jgi:hypothetical protein